MQTTARYIRSRIEQVLKKYPSAYDEVIIADLYTLVTSLLMELDKAKEIMWKHPAILAVKDVCKEYVPPGLISEIIAVVGDNPDKELMKKCYLEWHSRGKAQGGWGWILEWYRDGIPERFKKDSGERSLPFEV